MEWMYVDGLRRNDRAAEHPFRPPDVEDEEEEEGRDAAAKPVLLRGGAGTQQEREQWAIGSWFVHGM